MKTSLISLVNFHFWNLLDFFVIIIIISRWVPYWADVNNTDSEATYVTSLFTTTYVHSFSVLIDDVRERHGRAQNGSRRLIFLFFFYQSWYIFTIFSSFFWQKSWFFDKLTQEWSDSGQYAISSNRLPVFKKNALTTFSSFQSMARLLCF